MWKPKKKAKKIDLMFFICIGGAILCVTLATYFGAILPKAGWYFACVALFWVFAGLVHTPTEEEEN